MSFFPASESIDHLDQIQGKRIVIGIMDWGLGHATRSVPVIKKLAGKNELIICSAGAAFDFLNSYFPNLKVVQKPGYDIRYHSFLPVVFALAFRTPWIYSSIQKENKWLDKLVSSFNPDLIISDNCYGFYNKKSVSIIITHQMMLKVPKIMAFSESMVRGKIVKWCSRFDQIWIPDFADRTDNLSGDLSHHYPSIPGQFFIGPLSRFSDPVVPEEKDIDVCYLISGPEPLRSRFFERCFNEAERSGQKTVIISGTPGKMTEENSGLITVYSHLPDEQLADVLSRSKRIVCRSGYSTIMDLYALGLEAEFIPTPGQTEQEYLSQWLAKGIGSKRKKAAISV